MTKSTSKPRTSKLDRAAVASVLAMTVFVFAHQLQPAPTLASASAAPPVVQV